MNTADLAEKLITALTANGWKLRSGVTDGWELWYPGDRDQRRIRVTAEPAALTKVLTDLDHDVSVGRAAAAVLNAVVPDVRSEGGRG